MAPHKSGSTSQEASETTPLLAVGEISTVADAASACAIAKIAGETGQKPTSDTDHGPADSARNDLEGDTNVDQDEDMPKAQVFWLCVARLIEPIAFFSIFPYINEFVRRSGDVPVAQVGFYSGLIESNFSLVQAIVMVFWARLSDRIGRKPVLMASMVGVTVSTSMFGFAQTIPQMIMLRMLAGVFSGTLVTIRTCLAELSTPGTRARIFSWFAFSGNLGIFLGPLIGGILADPVGQYGGLFERIPLFSQYPYALPSLAVGATSAVSTIVCMFKVKETKGAGKGASSSSAQSAADKSMPIRELLREPGVLIVQYVGAHLALLAFAYTTICPLWWWTTVDLGGLSFNSFQMSLLMALNGVAQALWLIFGFPPLHRRLGTNGVMRLCGTVYPLFFAISPVANYLLRAGYTNLFWSLYPPALAIGCGVAMSFTACQLSVNEVNPGPTALATINALQMMISSIVRAFTPAAANSLFAIGAETQFLNGYAIWLLMSLLAAGFGIATRFLPDYEALRLQRLKREAEAGRVDVPS
ncbi:uncharacterized protein PgNI_09365 [Pyricularia grisea]|uniref:Major facilitator superfamily (MFS) profile domain-containing protein n=1 Tax=Pyricularia grisea TaxID=148305 RepID=A0A6P8ARU7_PYRGI|nr:uncharacterized protein PgNI_09365 [Pyricularia grisea]TLD04817.1 hypothetical protein PgNI_09365 [Pyricularia grisea]